MPMNAVVASRTPYYVLMDGDGRIGPNVVQLDAKNECLPIYGFSGKGPYEKFCTNSEQALKPYPLVKGYLQDQANTPGDCLKLVVIDATGPSEPNVHAATMAAVLEAQMNKSTHVTTAYHLMFDHQANAYHVEEVFV